MPKDRYRLYHLEKARGGVGLTMIGGSAVVSPDSPPAFGNLLLYKDEIVPWLRRLADDVPRGRCRRDVPGDPPRTAHQQLHRRLAAAGLPLAAPRARAPQLPQDRRALGPRPHRRRLRRRRPALPAAGLDGIELAVLRAPVRRLPLPGHQPPRRRRSAASLEAPAGLPAARRSTRCARRSGPTSSSASGCRWTRTLPDGLGLRRGARGRCARYRERRHRLPQRHQGRDRERRHAWRG